MISGKKTNQPATAGRLNPAALFIGRLLSFFIQLYRFTLSPVLTVLFGPDGGCRFTPTCSQYANEAIQEHGALAGSWMAVKRVCRCHPFGRCGHDPVPPALRTIERQPHTC